MPSKKKLIINFTDAERCFLSGGSVTVQLSRDAQSPDGLVGGKSATRVQLKADGQFPDTQVWPNAALIPLDTSYVIHAYSADGELVKKGFYFV